MHTEEPISTSNTTQSGSAWGVSSPTPVPADFNYRNLLEALLIVPWEADPESLTFSYVGPQAEAMLGFPVEHWYRPNFWVNAVHPEDRRLAVDFCVQETKEFRDHSFEYRMIRADGRIIWALDVVRVHRVGEKTFLRGLLLDITERKRTEDALRQSEARLTACVQQTPNVAIQWYDRTGRIVFWNSASEQMFGYSAWEAMGKTLDQLIFSPEEGAAFQELLDEIAATGESISPKEYHFRRRSGEDAYCLSTVFGIPSHNGDQWFVCMDVDITDRKRMEEQIRQAQKVESLGVLAGGVAHDFNNLLTGILGFTALADMELPEDSPAKASLKEVTTLGQRAAELTQQLLAYAGKGKFLVQPINLSWLIKEMSRLMQSGITKKAQLQLNLSDSLPTIEGDSVQIRQLVMSFVSNASESLHDREGTIQIQTGTCELSLGDLSHLHGRNHARPGSYVFVEVNDNGQGMDAATQSRIFDPFFSTKFTGRGLGLAAALGIVRSHHGLVKVESKPGHGSKFRVMFPVIQEVKPTSTASKSESGTPWRGSGTILLVDDEAAIRGLSRVGLQRAGFHVEEAIDGQSAIDLFRQNPRLYTAVLLDLVMPKKDGAEVLREIRQLNPSVPVILISGYTEQEVQTLLGPGGASAFLHKPFNSAKLTETLRQVLHGGVTHQ